MSARPNPHAAARTAASRQVRAACPAGTDPDRTLAVLSWLVVPRHGPGTLRRLVRERVEAGDDPDAAMLAVVGEPTAERACAAGELAATWGRLGAQVALVGDAAYPAELAAGWPDTDAPVLLAWRGERPRSGPSIAVVGARRASGYGTAVAAWLAEAAARAGARVVSGGAHGIDAAAHEAALEEPGGTTVVLGCGHAVAYPRDHARPGGLFDRVLDHGGSLVSELLPHEAVRPGTVRARNRIVAGLADAVVVVEGGERSGALLTATAAAELGRPVLAVPGDVRAPGSVAPHRLLAEGAAPCTGPADVLDALPALPPAAASGGHRSVGTRPDVGPPSTGGLPQPVHRRLVAAWPRPLRLDDLAAQAGIPTGRLLAAITRARVAGVVAEGVDGVRLRRPPR